MNKYRSFFSFRKDSSGLVLPNLVGLVMFLASLTVMSALVVNAGSRQWLTHVSGTVVVQIMPLNSEETQSQLDERSGAAANLLKTIKGITKVDLVDRAKALKLVEPWLGSTKMASEFTLPRLIGLSLSDADHFNFDGLNSFVTHNIKGATVDDYRLFGAQFVRFSVILTLVAWGMTALVATVVSIAVLYATRVSLVMYGGFIEVMNLMGAYDSYIARGLAWRLSFLCFLGSSAGLVTALGAMAVIISVTGLSYEMILKFLTIMDFVKIIALPFLTALLAWLVTEITVRQMLKKGI